jgi:hypothetical protein
VTKLDWYLDVALLAAGFYLLLIHAIIDFSDFIFLSRFDSKDAATKAIVAVSGTQINGFTVRCSWGKETTNSVPTPSSVPGQYSSQPVQPYATVRMLFTRFSCF